MKELQSLSDVGDDDHFPVSTVNKNIPISSKQYDLAKSDINEQDQMSIAGRSLNSQQLIHVLRFSKDKTYQSEFAETEQQVDVPILVKSHHKRDSVTI